ncbi:MAG: hypothetical protein KKE62_11250 [Proteobacteria bacterium]|nr:hypothetical protein [Pseudomonadota bacterium]MBU1389181.1 hypothetical protein [Pseudomonadota bacterium]MBU1543405.1 hypothetical protein [Pseudomonadota bacterium]MBU2482900.1 hypothetical protein [Pseudomonadota bacterium]
MLLKKTIGILIILANIGGIGFLIFLLVMALKEKFFSKEHSEDALDMTSAEKPHPKIANNDIVPDEDDLLKDMDLSDLDNLNLDDFD